MMLPPLEMSLWNTTTIDSLDDWISGRSMRPGTHMTVATVSMERAALSFLPTTPVGGLPVLMIGVDLSRSIYEEPSLSRSIWMRVASPIDFALIFTSSGSPHRPPRRPR